MKFYQRQNYSDIKHIDDCAGPGEEELEDGPQRGTR